MLFNNIRTLSKGEREREGQRDVTKERYMRRVQVSKRVYICDVLRISLTCFAFRFEGSKCPYDYALNLSSYKNEEKGKVNQNDFSSLTG